jgi:hypothetical protein
MPRSLLKLSLVLSSAPVLVAAALAWGAPAIAGPPPIAGAPAPLPVIGAAAAFGFSRKLRQRITSTQADSSRIG